MFNSSSFKQALAAGRRSSPANNFHTDAIGKNANSAQEKISNGFLGIRPAAA
jgi:hypothetical protein